MQVLLHGGNTAGLAYPIMICSALGWPWPASLSHCDVMIISVVRLFCISRRRQGLSRGRERRDVEPDSDWKAGVWRIWGCLDGQCRVCQGLPASQPVRSGPAPMEKTRFCAGRVQSGAMLQVLESCGEMRQTARIWRDCPSGT